MTKVVSLFLFVSLMSSAWNTEGASVRKRFLLDSFINFIGHGFSMTFEGECALCKCNNTCNGELLLHVKNETAVCGRDLWNSIKCEDVHNKQVSPTSTTQLSTTTTGSTATTPTNAPNTMKVTATSQSTSTLDPIQETFCANRNFIRCGTTLEPICGSDKVIYLNKCEYSIAICDNHALQKMDMSFCSGR